MLPINSSIRVVPRPVFSEKTCASAISPWKPMTKILPEILRRLEFCVSVPILMIWRPITFWIYGVTRDICSWGPAIAKMSVPAAAAGLAPKTGEAINSASLALKAWATAELVEGCIVDMSMNSLPWMFLSDKAFSTRVFKTTSSVICSAAARPCQPLRKPHKEFSLRELTIVKITSDDSTTVSKSRTGVAPAAFSASPLSKVRLLYTSGGALMLLRWFCRFRAMPMPMDPSPYYSME